MRGGLTLLSTAFIPGSTAAPIDSFRGLSSDATYGWLAFSSLFFLVTVYALYKILTSYRNVEQQGLLERDEEAPVYGSQVDYKSRVGRQSPVVRQSFLSDNSSVSSEATTASGSLSARISGFTRTSRTSIKTAGRDSPTPAGRLSPFVEHHIVSPSAKSPVAGGGRGTEYFFLHKQNSPSMRAARLSTTGFNASMDAYTANEPFHRAVSPQIGLRFATEEATSVEVIPDNMSDANSVYTHNSSTYKENARRSRTGTARPLGYRQSRIGLTGMLNGESHNFNSDMVAAAVQRFDGSQKLPVSKNSPSLATLIVGKDLE